MNQHDDFTKTLKTERLNELAFSFKKTGAMVLALELGLFTRIDEGHRTVSEIATVLDLDTEMVERLVSVCKAMDLVYETDGKLDNFDDVSRYLVKSKPTYFGGYLIYQPISEYDSFKNLAQHYVKPTGSPPQKGSYVTMMEDPDRARRFTEAGYNASLPLAHKLAKLFDYSKFNKWLDVAGGSGCYAIAASEKNPDLKVTILDFPNVTQVTREFVAKHQLENRIDTMNGNFFSTEFPTDCDLISYITPLQSYVPDEVIGVLKKTYDALLPGGTCLVMDYMLDDDKSGPLDPAFLNLQGLNRGHYTGRVQSGAEFKDFFETAGFQNVQTQWLMRHQLGFVFGTKAKAQVE
jgi:ubiquinone/menaquinone biosynthesis C-methylase UbiE